MLVAVAGWVISGKGKERHGTVRNSSLESLAPFSGCSPALLTISQQNPFPASQDHVLVSARVAAETPSGAGAVVGNVDFGAHFGKSSALACLCRFTLLVAVVFCDPWPQRLAPVNSEAGGQLAEGFW